MERMRQLVDLLNRYAKEYYELDNPTVSDAEYDAMYYELVELEKEYGALPDSPTHRVGARRLKNLFLISINLNCILLTKQRAVKNLPPIFSA